MRDQINALEPLAGLRLCGSPLDAAGAKPKSDVVENAQVREQAMVLEYEPDPASFGRQPGACCWVFEHGSVDLDMPFVDAKESRDDPEQGRLSSAVRSE